jgi:transposase
MSGRRYKPVINRHMETFFPPSLEDYVTVDNPVRAIDAYVGCLDLESFEFRYAGGDRQRGQPAYAPDALLKLYLYGYLNRVRSSRRLEKETQRNVEVIWLIEGLRPTYKTIADFRKDNAKGLRRVNKDFVMLCKELDLFGGELVGIDGSFFRASASKGSIRTGKGLEQEIARIEQDIEQYHQQLNQSDQQADSQGVGSLTQDSELEAKVAALRKRQERNRQIVKELERSGETQYSTTDRDARLLSKSGQTMAGYNVQHSIDAKHKLIVTHSVTHDGNDLWQLQPMAKQTQETLDAEALTVVADSGYYNPEQIKECDEVGISVYAPIPNKSRPIAKQGRFTREQFHFDAEANHYRCPAGQTLEQRGKPYRKRGRFMIRYAGKGSVCAACEKRTQCLTEKSTYRQMVRWEHEAIIDAHRARMATDGAEMMRQRSGLAEHPFGTQKRWFGWDHFLVRGFKKVRGEMSLLTLCYNFLRVIHILGLDALREYCARSKRSASIEDRAVAPA